MTRFVSRHVNIVIQVFAFALQTEKKKKGGGINGVVGPLNEHEGVVACPIYNTECWLFEMELKNGQWQ